MRYFRSMAVVYEQVRLTLDAAWGHPNAETKTATCIQPAAESPRDSAGRCLLSVSGEFCEYAAVAAVLPQLLASGAVEEITETEYRAALPTMPRM